MALLHTLPTADGFTMPAEFATHSATVLIWPFAPAVGDATHRSHSALFWT